MVSPDRQLIMETNRSLRNIKTELENLLEKGVIDENVFDEIHAALPEESPLSGPLRKATGKAASAASTAPSAPAPRASPNPTPAPRQPVISQPPGSPPREQVLFDSSRNEKSNGNFHNPLPTRSPAPPSYEDTPPPQMPPPPRNGKPVVAWARALYTYNASDGRDCSFVKDDKIAVHEYMNQDWWMGQNLRTGQEGIFPRNYVFVEQEEKRAVPQQQYGYPPQQQNPYPPQQQNPYNSSVPPMAVAEGSGQQQQGQEGDNKVGEYGKKFGKKLGNAAIFGAGATIGGNLVNSIF